MTPAFVGRFFLILAAIAAQAMAQQAQLRIVVIQGEGALNNTGGRANRDVIVEVQGANARPVAGAQVTFNLPLTGPGGEFANGEHALTVATGPDGRAIATGIRANSITGPLQVRVSATYQDQTATAVIQQTNVAVAVEEPPPVTTTTIPPRPVPQKGMSKTAKVLLILAIAGGAAAGATVALTRNGSSGGGGGGGGGTPPIVITPGTPSVGGPQ